MRRPAGWARAAVMAAVAAAAFAGIVAPSRHEVVGVSMAPGLLPGDVVTSGLLPVLDRWRRPARFERWLFATPDGTTAVKRVVGLPGERVSIADGDLLIDGKRMPPPPSILAGSAIMVSTLPVDAGPGRTPPWTADSPAWIPAATGHWAWHATDRSIDWLLYRHRVDDVSGGREAACRQIESAILDDAPFAPAERRLLLPVRDSGLAAVVRPDDRVATDSLRLLVRVGDAGVARTVAVPLAGGERLAVVAGRLDRHLVAAAWPLPADAEPAALSRSALPPLPPARWSIADPWPPPPGDEAAFARPVLGLGVESTPTPGEAGGRRRAGLTVERLAVWRDILHLSPADGTTDWVLGNRELFLLGDFPPGSRDCRHWGPIDAGRLLHPIAGPSGRRLAALSE